jgi:hypothetical protein
VYRTRSVLSGTLKLRDNTENINDLRAFAPSIVVQPLIGATGGLLLLLVLDSKLVNVNWGGDEWARHGVIALVAGFSEPFFLGIVGRVTAIAEAPDGGRSDPRSRPCARFPSARLYRPGRRRAS